MHLRVEGKKYRGFQEFGLCLLIYVIEKFTFSNINISFICAYIL